MPSTHASTARTCPRGSPPGRSRTPDSRDVFELMAAQEQEDIGQVAIEEADIVSDWAKPSHDLAGSLGRRLRRRRRSWRTPS